MPEYEPFDSSPQIKRDRSPSRNKKKEGEYKKKIKEKKTLDRHRRGTHFGYSPARARPTPSLLVMDFVSGEPFYAKLGVWTLPPFPTCFPHMPSKKKNLFPPYNTVPPPPS